MILYAYPEIISEKHLDGTWKALNGNITLIRRNCELYHNLLWGYGAHEAYSCPWRSQAENGEGTNPVIWELQQGVQKAPKATVQSRGGPSIVPNIMEMVSPLKLCFPPANIATSFFSFISNQLFFIQVLI